MSFNLLFAFSGDISLKKYLFRRVCTKSDLETCLWLSRIKVLKKIVSTSGREGGSLEIRSYLGYNSWIGQFVGLFSLTY